jgi:hypothetical protein
VTEALKLVSPFSGNKREVLTFVSNVETAFGCINPENKGRLYQFILTKISGEPRTAIAHRNLESWEELREFLKNTYTEKRTLDYHASQLFKAKQGKVENVSEWIQKIQTLGSKFREAALQDCTEDERAGILNLADRLRNICFTQGLYSDRIQTIVRSRNQDHFDEIAETALEEESALVSKHERYNGEAENPRKCGNCGKLGHSTQACFLKRATKIGPPQNGQARVNQTGVEERNRPWEITCYNCNRKGHYARDCRANKRRFSRRDKRQEYSGNETRLSADSQSTVSNVQ